MLFADCPLCDRPAPLDAETGALDCAACGVRLELAEEPALAGARRRGLTARAPPVAGDPTGRRILGAGLQPAPRDAAAPGRLEASWISARSQQSCWARSCSSRSATCRCAAFGAASAPTPNLLVVPFSFGFGLLAAIFAFGHISGGHFNPAVTVAMVLDRRTAPVEAVGYIVAQVVGALLAGAFVMVAINQAAVTAGITAPNTAAGITDMGALLMEIVATAGFIAVILASTKRAPALAALAIPLTLVAIHFATASLSGASVNPARSLGSAIVGGDRPRSGSTSWPRSWARSSAGSPGRLIDGGAETAPAEEPAAERAA